MNTLQDITPSITNRQRQIVTNHDSERNTSQPPSTVVDENSPFSSNMSDWVRPRYMTPTVASRSQSTKADRPATPQSKSSTSTSALTSSSGKRKAWMAHATRRLGINKPVSRTQGQQQQKLSQKVNVRAPSKVNRKIVCILIRSLQTHSDPDRLGHQGHQAHRYTPVGRTAQPGHETETAAAPRPPPKVHVVRSSPERKHSSPDKPLPSLPVATVDHRSPVVRRSLIDASEKSLRRSLSPSPGLNELEEWPAISPSRPFSQGNLQRVQEDLIQAQSDKMEVTQRSLPLECNLDFEGPQPASPKLRQLSNTDGGTESMALSRAGSGPWDLGLHLSLTDSLTPKVQGAELTVDSNLPLENTEAFILPSPPTESSNMSAGAVAIEKFVEGQCHLPNNEVRQALTSASRGGLSEGSTHSIEATCKAHHNVPEVHRHLLSPDQLAANSTRSSSRLSIPGHVRTPSDTCRASNAKTSPYGDSACEATNVVKPGMHIRDSLKDGAQPNHRPSSSGSTESRPSNGLWAVKEIKPRCGKALRSSIPRPRQVVRSRGIQESEAVVLIAKPSSKVDESRHLIEDEPGEDGGVDTDREDGAKNINNSAEGLCKDTLVEGRQTSSCQGPEDEKPGAIEQSTVGNFHDFSAPESPSRSLAETMYGSSDFSPIAANDSDVDSLRAFDGSEGTKYHLRHLSLAAPEHGPTLRISVAADRIIMGPPCDKEDEELEANTQSRKRNSVADLRRSAVIKEQIWKSTEGLLKAHLPISRSMTSRSLSRHAKRDADLNMSDLEEASSDKLSTSFKNVSQTGGAGTEDPFVERSHDVGLNHQSYSFLPCYDSDWPLSRAGTSQVEASTVIDEQSEEEKSLFSSIPVVVEHSKFGSGQDAPSSQQVTENIPCATRNGMMSASQNTNDDVATTKKRNAAKHSCKGTSVKNDQSGLFPPRGSSRLQPHETTFKNQIERKKPTDQGSQTQEIPKHCASDSLIVRAETAAIQCGVTAKSENSQNLDTKWTTASHANPSACKATRPLQRSEPRPVQATKSQASGSRKLLSNFRGLFHKRSGESGKSSDIVSHPYSAQSRTGLVGLNETAFPQVSVPLPSHTSSRKAHPCNPLGVSTPQATSGGNAVMSNTPAFDTPNPDEVQKATRLAIEVLDRARNEPDGEKKGKMLEVRRCQVASSSVIGAN